MTDELSDLIARLRHAYGAADRNTPGPFKFISNVGPTSGACVCVLVIAEDNAEARAAAARSLTEVLS